MADNISSLYEIACKKGVLDPNTKSEEWFREQISTEKGLRSFYDYATNNGMKIRPYDEFKQKLSQPIAETPQPAPQNPSVKDNPAPTTEKEYQENLAIQNEYATPMPEGTVTHAKQQQKSLWQRLGEFAYRQAESQPEVQIAKQQMEQDAQRRIKQEQERAAAEARQKEVAQQIEKRRPIFDRQWNGTEDKEGDAARLDKVMQAATEKANAAAGKVADEYADAYRYSGMQGGSRLAMGLETKRAYNKEASPDVVMNAFTQSLDEDYQAALDKLTQQTGGDVPNGVSRPMTEQELAAMYQKAGIMSPEDYEWYRQYVQGKLQEKFAAMNVPQNKMDYFVNKFMQSNLIGQLATLYTNTPYQRAAQMQGVDTYEQEHNDFGTKAVGFGADVAGLLADPTMLVMPMVGSAVGGAAVRGIAGNALGKIGYASAQDIAARAMMQRGILQTANRLAGSAFTFAGIDATHDVVNQLYQPVYNEETGQYENGDWHPWQTATAAAKGAITGTIFGGAGLLGDRVQHVIGEAWNKTAGLVAGKATHFVGGTNAMVGTSVVSQILQGRDISDINWGEEYANAAAMQLVFDIQGGVRNLGKVYRNAAEAGKPISLPEAFKLNWQRMKADPYAGGFTQEEIEQFNKAGYQGKDGYEILLNMNGGKEYKSLNELYTVLDRIAEDPTIDTQAKYRLASLIYGKVDANVRPVMTDVYQDEQGRYVVRTYDNAGQTYETRYFNSEQKAQDFRNERRNETQGNLKAWQEGVIKNYFFATEMQRVADAAVEEIQKQYPQYTREQLYDIMRESLLNPHTDKGKALAQDSEASAIRKMFEEYLSANRPQSFDVLGAIRQNTADNFGITAEEVRNILGKDYRKLDMRERGIYDDYVSRLSDAMPKPQRTAETQQTTEPQSPQGGAGTGMQALPETIRKETAAEVEPNTNKGDGNVYAVTRADDETKRGYVVSGKVEIDTTDPAAPRISNNDVVTVRYEDGTIEQLSAKDLNLAAAPSPATDVIQQITDERVATAQVAEQVAQTFHAGQEVAMDDGSGNIYTSRVVSVSEDGVEVEIENAQGEPDTTIIPNEIALTALHPIEQTEQQTQTESTQNITPIGEGDFGYIYDQFAGKPKEAIAFLTEQKSGEALGALHHNEVGDIDLVWGYEGTGKSDGFGLAKLLKYHPEVVDNLQEILNDMHVVKRSENRIQLESDKYAASVRLTWNDEKKTWLLTAFQKKSSAINNTTDTAETLKGMRNDTATPQSTANFTGKGTTNSANVQVPAPNIDTMSYSELGAATVEYMGGDRATAVAYLEAERSKAETEVKRLAKQSVKNYTDIADFKRQNDQLQAAKKIAADRYNKLQNAITAANHYQTQAEQAEQAARKAREEEQRVARRQTQTAQLANPAPAERWQAAPKVEGNAVARTLPDGTTIRGHYVLVEAGAATPSHDPFNGWNTSDGFPVTEDGKNINDRDYKNDQDARQITTQIAQTYDGQAVTQVPVVSSEGIVYDGNGRTIAGNIAAANNTDGAYIQALADNAGNFGFTAEQVAGMQHPRVYMQTDEDLPYNTTTFAKFNAQEKKSQGSTNRAVSSSKKLTEAARDGMLRILDNYGTLDAFFASETGAKDIVRSLLDNGIITQQEVAGLTENTDRGFVLSPAGKDYVTDLLIGGLFDEQTIRMLGNDKGLKQSILRAMPSIIENRRLGGYALTDNINGAIRLLYEARQAGVAYPLYIRQVDAFEGKVSDRFTPFEMLLAEEMSSGVENFRQVLNLYNNSARDDANGQTGLFEPRTIEDIKNEILQHYANRKQQPTAAAEPTTRPANPQTQPPLPSTPTGDERGRGNTQNPRDTGGRQQYNLGEKYSLSDEIDENGQQFVLNSNGELEFGKIDKESGLRNVPILLSEGVITDPATNTGYGLVHINARHGEEIRKAGYSSVVSFIEDVARNYERIKEGKDRDGNKTYLLQLTDKNNNTLIVELSNDGTYWNINTAGIFRNSYGKGNVVYERHATNTQSAETAAESLGGEQSSTTLPTSIKSATQQEELSSAHKGTNNIPNPQISKQKSAENLLNASQNEQTSSGQSSSDNRRRNSEGTPKDEQSKNTGKQQSQSQQSGNKIFTDDAYEAARRRMHERLNRLNAGLDPEMLSDGLIMAGYHVEKGARKFAEFAREMIREFGDKIRPYLKSFYNGLRDLPEAAELSKEMDDYGTVAQFDVNNFDFKERYMPSIREYSDINGQKIVITDVVQDKNGEPYYNLEVTDKSEHTRKTTLSVFDFNKELETKGIFDVEKSSNPLPNTEKSVTLQPKKVDVEGLFGALNTKGEAKLSDHIEQEPLSSAKAEDKQPIGKVTQSKHTKTGEDIWIVKPSERVSDDEFKLLRDRAKANNGYYSSFAKNRGFIFKSEEDANNFNNISNEEITTDQTSADTETAVRTAETVVGETASITRDRRDSSRTEGEPGTEGIEGGVREPRNVELTPEQANEQVTTRQQAIDKIDNANDKITNQLAVLGFYEADTTGPTKFHESYGYIKTAEAKAVKDIDRLAKQLADDLGIKVSKRKTIAKANIAPAGGDISFRLPLENGKELYLSVDIEPNFNNYYRADGDANSLVADHMFWRIEDPQANGTSRYLTPNQNYGLFERGQVTTTYADLLRGIRRTGRNYLSTIPAGTTKQEIAKQVAEKTTRKKKDTTRIADTQPMLDLFGDVADTMNEGVQQEQDGWNPQASTDEELQHGYNIGDKVLYQGKTAEIVGFDNGRFVLDLMGGGWNAKLVRFDEVEPTSSDTFTEDDVTHGRVLLKNGDVKDILMVHRSQYIGTKEKPRITNIIFTDGTSAKFEDIAKINVQQNPINNGNTELRKDGRGENGTAQTEPTRQPRNENGALGGSEQPQDERPVGRRVDTSSKPHRVHDGERSAGTPVQPAEQTVAQSGQTDIEPSQWRNTHNFHARGGERLAPTAPKARYEANLAAIRLLKQLQDEGRQATAQEKDILVQYSGWGGLGEFFKGEPGTTYYSQHGEQSPYQVLQSLLTDEELQAAQLSRNSAYYTPESVINSMWQVAERLGFKGGNILEGSAGIGNIFALMPSNISHRSNLTAVEIDDITAGILSQLYPDATTYHAGFQDVDIPNNSQDLVITNVPFVTGLHVYDKQEKDLSKRFGNIHDFCIAKNVRKLKQGGLGIFISSSGTLDNSKDLRVWLNNEGDADVIGTFRLNRDTFGGTSATSDIIVVRKRVNGQKDPRSIDVLDTATARIAKQPQDEVFDKYINQFKKPADKEIKLVYNKYFVEHPLSMGGEMGFGFEHGDTRWGGTTAGCYPEPTINQTARLKDWIDGIEQSEQLPTYDELKQGAQVPNGTYETYEGAVPYGSLILNSKGEICKAYHGTAVPVEGINSNKVKGYPKAQVLKDYNAIKQAIDNLLLAQTKNVSDSELKPYLQQLNRVYDDFVRKYGNLNRNTSLAFLRNDVQWASVTAIEKVKETVDVNGKKKIQVAKTDLFSKRVVGVQAIPKAENTRDGIILSMQQFGTIRPDKIAEWLGKPTDEVEKEIIGTRLGFRDPQTGNIQVRYEYLSGNVREKLAYAEEHNGDGSLNANIEELRKVIPIDIPAHLIEFNIGSTWIPKELYLQYAKEKYDLDNLKLNHVGSAWVSNDVWGRNEKNRSEGVYSDMLGIQIYGHELMLAAMNNVPVVVSRVEKHSDGTSETRTDKVASAACSDKISQIKDDFVDWARGKMQQDSELADRIQKIYNDRFNAIVPMLKVDKEFLSEHLPGQNSAKYTLYPHQQQAVARGLTQALMLAHEVGTGKTISLISTAMEMRRLGTAKKPMIVVQNATTQQFVADAKDLYPNAKILTVSDRDRTTEGRQEFYAKIKYNDWDLIIVPQSVFDMIPDSEARMRDFINEKIEEKMHAIEAAKEAGLDNNVTKRMERELGMLQEDLETNNMSGKRSSKKAKEKDAKKEAEQRANTEARAQAMLDRKTDDIENFDEMGIDALLIDEAHNYKHLGFATMMTRGVKGVDPSYSKRAAALYLKCQSIYERNGHKNVIFATGTPISNTAAEIWTFMKYLMPKQTLQENEIYYFDDFVHNFGKINEQLEFATNGKFKANNRFAQYGNVPELMRLWLSVADCTLTREVGQVNDKVPELERGKAQDIFLPQSPSLIDIMSAVRAQLEEYENMSGKEKRENSHIPLTMYGIAKRAAIDPRLVDANAVDEPLSKTNRAVEEVLRSLNDSKKYNGTVAIFCDSYQNKQSGFNLFNDIKEKLTKQGVPANQIAIIRSEMSDSAKQKIFDAVREGDIRVIMGSTQTLGTGVNIQTRLHTLIHMDAPDRPMDYTQRNGRILRQGNMHKEWGIPVRVLRFGVEDSLDVTSYQRLKTKAGFIDSIMNGKSMIENNLENRVLEDVDEGIFDNPVAMLSGSQYALLKSQAERDLRKWSARAQQYRIDQILIAKKTKDNEKIIVYRKQKIADNEKLIELLSQTFPDGKVSEYNINGIVCHTAEEVKNALKEVNKDVTAESDALRKDVHGGKKALSYPIALNGIPFNVDVQLTRKVSYKDNQSIVSIEKEVLYSAPTLGIEPIASPTKVMDRLIDMIQDDIISGKQARGENAYFEDYIKRLEKENVLMREREGKPFEHQADLEKAQTLVDEYTKKMQAELAEKEAKYANQSRNSVNLDAMDSEDDATDTPEAQYTELDYDADNLTDAQQLATDTILYALDNAGIPVERVSEEQAEREAMNVDVEQMAVAEKFNDTLARYTDDNADNIKFDCGMPSEALLLAGMPHQRIVLNGQTLRKKAKAHGFNVDAIKDLPIYLQSPIAVFNGSHDQTFAVLVEMTINSKNAIVAIDIKNAEIDDFVLVSSLYDKNKGSVIEWINGGKLLSVDKEKALRYIGTDAPIAPAGDNKGANSAAKVVQNFDSAKSFSGKSVETLRNSNGTIYGYAKDGKIYLTDRGLNPNTPIHEYTHLWVKAVRNNNAELYDNLRNLFSRESLPDMWDELDNDPQYRDLSDEAKLSEIIARFSSKRGAERMEQEAQKRIDEAKQQGKRAIADAVSLRERMRNLLRRFWNWVGEHLFHIKHFGSREEAADRVLYDLLNGTDLRQSHSENDSQAEFSAPPTGDSAEPKPRLTRGEVVTKILVQNAKNDYNTMQAALNKVSQDIKGICAAMRLQSGYDRNVVSALLNLYNTLLQSNNVWAGYMPDTTQRVATQIVNAIGKQDISKEVNTIMDYIVDAQAKAAQRQWDKLRQTPIDKINISGVVAQGKVALQGQYALKALNNALESKLTADQLEEMIGSAMANEENATDESLRTQYKGKWIGYSIAQQYLERVGHLKQERQQLLDELNAKRADKALKPAASQQVVDNIKEMLRDNNMEQANAYIQSARDLQDYIAEQGERAKGFIEKQNANREKIRGYAAKDLAGVATNPNRLRTKRSVARSVWDAFASPIRDLQSMLRLCGMHAPDGEGYLYNHFMRNWIDGADRERQGIVEASKTLDNKIADLTRGKYKTWEEAARKINNASHNKFSVTMLNGVDKDGNPVNEEIPLNAGNALYIYAVNKMEDGKMKLAAMNITDADVEKLTNAVREKFGQEIIDVVDWIQSEYFSQLRNRYNPVHEDLFGAPMDAIENYFPLRINANARQKNEDLGDPDTEAARLLTGTSTGAIKRRTRNTLPLDVRNADFFSEVIRHIAQMERWSAFAQWTRDANILFSDIDFRNRVKGMDGTIYGSGDQLYNHMKDAFRVAVGTYKPNTDAFSEFTLNAAKGVTSAKINFRLFTAIKQLASFPAFFTYMTDGVFVRSYMRNWLKPHETMQWAKTTLPNFEKRVSKRDMGDMRLMQRSTDWQWNKRILEISSKYGMAANVLFDTLTCATGARAIYDSRYTEYKQKGYTEEESANRARQDAEMAFNTSQQSSEGAFMAPIQLDRNLATAALTVFRTSNFQYTRNLFYNIRNLKNKLGQKEDMIASRKQQYIADGLTDEQARRAAEHDWSRSNRSDIIGIVVYGALLNLLWRLFGNFPYLIFGDDNDKKAEIARKSVTGGAFVSPVTGLLGGGIVEQALDGYGDVSDMFAPELPFTQDVKKAMSSLKNDRYAEFASQALSVLMQSGAGFDPQTAADMIARVVTTLDSEQDLDAAEKALRVSQAVLSIPQSQYEQMLIDEVIDNRRDYRDALADYQRYMSVHNAPLTWYMRNDESQEKADKSAETRFKKLYDERKELRN